MEKKYPIGGYAPGNYHCKCWKCGADFTGDKRAVECEPCAIESKARFDAMTPAQQESVIKSNIDIWNKLVNKWGADQLNPDLLKVFQDAEATKESALQKVKEDIDLEEQANAIYQKYCTDKGLVYHLMDAANFCLGYIAAKAEK